MPATGTLDTTYVGIGPGFVYLNCTLPGAGAVAQITVGANGRPEPDAGQLLGLTPEGNTINIGYEQTSVEADEVTGPIYQVIETETLSIAGSAMQVESLDMLKHMTPTASQVPVSPAVPTHLTWGGRPDLAPYAQGPVLIVWKMRSLANAYMHFQLYKAVNTDGTSFQITRRAMTQASYTFQGQVLGTRAAGDMIGALVRGATEVL
jgi:hypothetical protein